MGIHNRGVARVTHSFTLLISSKCVSHFVCGHFLRPWSIYNNQSINNQFTITSVSIGACNGTIKVTYMEVSNVIIYSYRLCMTL